MGQPKTRILFTENGRPVEGLHVRAREEDEPVATDADGQVTVPLQEGRQTLRILKGGEWVPQIVQTNRESSLIVVDLAKGETGEFLKPPTPDTSFLDIGKLNLGERYVYREIIGRGGMSVVLRAHDRLLNREVAVKVLSQELQAQTEAQQIFLTEARNLATLSHPNLVSVHDICKVENQVFMVIEFVEGESLEKLVNAVKGFNETVALQTVIQLARVLGYLHDHNIIHRDIKPANAMLRNDGTVKLIDFGLARHFDELQVRGTRVRGTPAYMSPEQITGEPLTPACDVYQLGVCLFEALTGRLPFSGKGDIGYQHVHEEAPRVRRFVPDVSEDLDELLARCLAKNPLERPQNGQQMLRELQVIYQKAGGAGQNLYKALQQDAAESAEIDVQQGYSTSELRLMESAGKHLRTSEFTVQSLHNLLNDPNNQSRIVINTGPRWSAIILACVVTSTVGAGLMFGLMKSGAFSGDLSNATTRTDEIPRHTPPAPSPATPSATGTTAPAVPANVVANVVEPPPSENPVVDTTATVSAVAQPATKAHEPGDSAATTEAAVAAADAPPPADAAQAPDEGATQASADEAATQAVAATTQPTKKPEEQRPRAPSATERKLAKRSGLFAPKKQSD